MIVCRRCRASNADSDAFCGSCGAFLEWTGERVAPAAPPDVEPEPEQLAPGGRPGLLERVQHAIGAVIAPAVAREDGGTEWTGFGKDAVGAAPPAPGAAAPPKSEPTPGGGKPAAKGGTPPPPGAGASKPDGSPAAPAKPAPGNGKAQPDAAPAAATEPAPGDGKAEPDAAPTAQAKPDAAPTAQAKPDAAPTAQAKPDAAPAAVAGDTPPPSGSSAVTPPRDLASSDAGPLVVEIEDDAVSRREDAASAEVLPQRVPTRVAPVVRTKPTRRLQPGDLVCGQCGEGNPPTRKFCSRCGESLTTAEVVRPRWYTKLMFWRRRAKTLEAGTRTGQKGAPSNRRAAAFQAYRRLRAVVAALMLLVSMLYVVVPPLRTPVNNLLSPPVRAVKDWGGNLWHKLTANTVTLPPTEVRASAALPTHKATAAFDDNTNTFWAGPWSAKHQPYLTIRFNEAVDLVAYAVHAGAPGEDASEFLHPRELEVRYASGRTDVIKLTASGDAQTGNLNDATSFRLARITVTEVYPEAGIENVALSEIELKERK